MVKLSSIIVICLSVQVFIGNSVCVSHAETMTVLENVESVDLVDSSKSERGVCYAGKLTWDGSAWRRQIVVYNDSPEPANDHPVRSYVKKIPSPTYKGVKKWESFKYKEFTCK